MTVELAPITDADVAVVADFLHANFNPRVSSSTWSRVMSVPWKVDAPNHGFMQLADRDDHLFSDDAITQINEAARGKPRSEHQTPPGTRQAGFLLHIHPHRQ